MPELPEIASRAGEMRKALSGRTIRDVELLQPKCLNKTPAGMKRALKGATLGDTAYHGKWLFTETTRGHLLINLGMGGDMLLVREDELPEKRQAVLFFDDGEALSIRFWWFGHVHHVPEGKLGTHRMSAKLGPNALDVTKSEFRELLRGRHGAAKSFLLNQERIAGIGNAYSHDILFLAGLHPERKLDTLSGDEVDGLWQAIRDGLLPALRKRGAWYERDLRGRRGGFRMDDILVGYKEGKPCPTCGAEIVKKRTGSTASFFCPRCQPLNPKKKAAAKRRAAPRARTRKPAAKKPAKKTTPKKDTRKPARKTARRRKR
ncbi:MAG: Fpg/Nei family DNA glycosylase [Candidatus Eisenbacteria bacterium]|nr:Fpg/Nei family DNA glycosylase [Candidatus Eisenbacteria bacterium]